MATTPGFMTAIDWNRPWFASVLPAAQRILAGPDWRAALNVEAAEGLRNHRGMPIRFVPQEELPAGTPYEAHISATGRVPTRENLHDFFNALVWLSFPATKARLNALQSTEIEKSFNSSRGSEGRARGGLRDATTIFDENAAIFVARDDSVIDALHGHRWKSLFVDHRSDFGQTWEVWSFGHALMEKLVSPYKAITAHAWIVHSEADFFTLSAAEKHVWMDEAVAKHLSDGLRTRDFAALPVMGLPDWHSHQDEKFYDDPAVFRPKRDARP